MTHSEAHLTIIAATFHQAISDEMITAANKTATTANTTIHQTIRVPGSYEIPLIAQSVIEKRPSDALVILAYIEKGETLHGEVMGHVVHRALIDLQLAHHTPMGLGIIGPGATLEQAQIRATPTAEHAVQAALSQHQQLAKLS